MTRKTREAAIFVYRGDKFLITHRTSDGIWSVVAGQIEDGESFADGAARELMEEAVLEAPLLDLELTQAYEVEPRFRHLYAPGEYNVTVASYVVEAPAGWEPTLNHEHSEYRWCSVADAIELAHWPELKEGIRTVARRLGLPY
ncbi:MAG: NUDIX domain-containing protein [Chloroflexi bacterium]|nr:MAG: NUDIX domain-containing protein [Chloroflexota bacterium]